MQINLNAKAKGPIEQVEADLVRDLTTQALPSELAVEIAQAAVRTIRRHLLEVRDAALEATGGQALGPEHKDAPQWAASVTIKIDAKPA